MTIRTIEWIDGSTEKDVNADVFAMDSEELGGIDRMSITITYPDGSEDTRWFYGPWDDYDDVWYDVIEWYEDGTP